MSWTKKQIEDHKRAASSLNEIITEIAEHIRYNSAITDVAVGQFIKACYKKYGLVSDRQGSIVAFGRDTAEVHFYANQPRRLKKGDLIMIDIWSRLAERQAPFADITAMLYYGGKVPSVYARAFKIVIRARDLGIEYIGRSLKKGIVPISREVDKLVRDFLAQKGHGEKFLHGTGHSLGLTHPHGNRTRINRRGRQALPLNVGYTIEPGIYFKNFGVRSEIDFYINENYKFILTTKKQKKIITIK